MHEILMITFNRPTFTKMSLERLLDSCDSQMRVWVWHNGPDEATLTTVRSFQNHPRLHKIHVSPDNRELREPTNWFWRNSQGEFLSKVDDDCLVPDDWGQDSAQPTNLNRRLGSLAAGASMRTTSSQNWPIGRCVIFPADID